MSLSRWFALIGLLVGVGFLQVAERTALCLTGYGVGERLSRLHAIETDVTWLDAEVLGLASPAHLAEVAKARRLKLVAWSRLSIVARHEDPPLGATVQLAAAGQRTE